MKKISLLLFYCISFLSITAQNMPYYLKYKVDNSIIDNYYGSYDITNTDNDDDYTIMYHNTQAIDYLQINDIEHYLRLKNYTHEVIPISAIDTVYVYHDKFHKLENPENWTDIIYSTEQIYFYKENTISGKPEILLMVACNDTLPNGQFCYISFNTDGLPNFMNINGQMLFIENIYENYYDAIVVNPDKSFFYADSIPILPGSILNYNKIATRSAYTQSNAQNAASLLNHFIGGLTMAEGGIAILAGCSMLVPGANIAVGATIAIAGAATFIAGALITTRATDQLISDGSHTQGFDIAADILGIAGTLGGQGSLAGKAVQIAFDLGWSGTQMYFDANADLYEAYERAKRIVEGRLSTGKAELYNIQSNAVMFYGNITKKMNNNDKVGIMISEDVDALSVKNCMYSENSEVGEFYALFDELTPTQIYYYRAYYYATEFDNENYSPYFVSSIKTFTMPGVKTIGYTEKDNYTYTIKGNVAWLSNDELRYVGVCFSQTNENPTIDDNYKEITHNEDGDFSITLKLGEGGFFYRVYAQINGEIVYGETMFLTDERSMLVKLYKDTNGESWKNNDNWCTENHIRYWYGVESSDNQHVYSIILSNNNLNGNVSIKGLHYLTNIDIKENNIKSVTIDDCKALDLGYGFKGLNGINLESLTINNCFHGKGQHFLGDEDDITTITNITFLNMRDLGRIFFNNVQSNTISFKNCQFGDQGIGVEDHSNVNTLIVEDCVIPSGRVGGYGVNNLIIKNSIINDWWVIGAGPKAFISISNTYIGGKLINIAGTVEELRDKGFDFDY